MARKKTRKGVEYEEIDGEVVAKQCTECNAFSTLDAFPKDAKGFAGKGAKCKACHKRYRAKNALKIASRRAEDVEYYRQYRESNREKLNANNRNWAHANREYLRIKQQKRRASIRALPYDLTAEQIEEIYEYFDGRCALTGERCETHLDHFIPLATGYGGTTLSNMIPLRADLNMSKNAQNPIAWFAENKHRFNMDERRFDDVLEYLAKLNGVTVPQYVTYIESCYSTSEAI